MSAITNTDNASLFPLRTTLAGFIALAIIVVALLDVVSTNVGLLAGAVEVNPFMAMTQSALGSWWFVPKMCLHLVAVVIVILYPVRQVFACVGGAAVVNAAVVVNNFALAGII